MLTNNFPYTIIGTEQIHFQSFNKLKNKQTFFTNKLLNSCCNLFKRTLKCFSLPVLAPYIYKVIKTVQS